MKTHQAISTKQGGEPAAAHSTGAGPVQRKMEGTPRQMVEAAHIAQLKGEAKPKGKMPPPKKGKGK